MQSYSPHYQVFVQKVEFLFTRLWNLEGTLHGIALEDYSGDLAGTE